jgi:hypothetical protein
MKNFAMQKVWTAGDRSGSNPVAELRGEWRQVLLRKRTPRPAVGASEMGQEETSPPSRTRVNNVVSSQSCQQDVPKSQRRTGSKGAIGGQTIQKLQHFVCGAISAPIMHV